MGRKWWGVALALWMGAANANLQEITCESLKAKIGVVDLPSIDAVLKRLNEVPNKPEAEATEALMRLCGIGFPIDTQRGEAQLRRLADAGSTESMGLLIYAYSTGVLGLAPSHFELARVVRIAAKKSDNPELLVLVADDENGLGRVLSDAYAAESALVKAASRGYAPAMRLLGMNYFDAKRYEAALPWLRLAGVQGEEQVYERLVRIYGFGLDGQVNQKQAFYWLEQILKVGGRYAYDSALALTYQISSDRAESLRWLQLQADAGIPAAMLLLGDAYDNVEEALKDEQKADVWWRKAEAAGAPPATSRLEVLKNRRAWKFQRESTERQFRDAAADGLPASQLKLARWLDTWGTRTDANDAYLKAIQLGSPNAMVEFGARLIYADAGEAKRKEGFALIQQAASERFADANLWLMRAYLAGSFVARNVIAAYAFDYLANEPEAQVNESKLQNYRPSFDDAMTVDEVANAQQLVRDMLKPGNFAAALSAVSAN